VSSQPFIGEIELTTDFRAEDFERFESLPLAGPVRELGNRFFGIIEIMPYQRQGEGPKLALSVYLKPARGSGRVIAVLMKEDFPRDMKTLGNHVKKAKGRLETMTHRAEGFEGESLEAAKTAVDELSRLVATGKKGGPR
jgi:hypothetical protein